nr:hypothetical protein [Tanacetum cinerariifolium]
MDSTIPLGQKNTLSEYMILSGADNRPPMLDKDLIKKYAELSAAEKIQADCDMKATNIVLQGLPVDIYSLINHHRVANDLWERVQLLMQGDDPIACLNMEMAFLTAVASSKGDKESYFGTGYKSNASSSGGEMQVDRQNLDEEQLTFLTDPGVPNGQAVQLIIPNNAAFQTEDLDTYDSDCDDVSNAKAILMANIFNYSSDVISEVPHSETYLNDMENQSVHAMQDFEQTPVVNITDNEITSDSNIISKHFVPQQELSADEAFWYHMLNPSTKSSDALPVKIEAPKELPKVSLVNERFKKLKLHLANFDKVVKTRTTPNARTEENSVAKLLSKNKRLCKEINHVKQVFKDKFDSIKKTRVRTKEHIDSLIDKLNLQSIENEDLKAHIQDKVFVITSLKNDLRKVKRKEIIDIAAQIPFAITIVLGMFKLDLDSFAPKLFHNKEAHIDYLEYTQEQADILQGIVKQAKVIHPLDNALDFSCRHAQRIQESLVYVRDTCPNAIKLSAKKVVAAPKNNVKKVRFLRTKDESPKAIIKCIKNIQVCLNATVRNVRTDNGTEFIIRHFVNFYENVGISHQTSIARTPQQNDAKAINTTCYPTNDNDGLGKLDAKADIDTPMVEKSKLDEDLQGKPVDATLYYGMIGSHMYLISSRSDLIMKSAYDTAMSLTAYADADHAGCRDTRRSTSGSAQFLGDKLVSWSSKKKKSTAISNYGFQFNKIPLYRDNKCEISLCCNNIQHSRAKHIDVRYHFIKEQVENGIVELYFVRTEYQLADIITKHLPRERFNFLIEKLGTMTALQAQDPEEDPVDYPTDGGDDDNDEEGSSEDDEDDDIDIEADEEEEEHPAPADSVVVASTATDQAPSAEETEPFETDEEDRPEVTLPHQKKLGIALGPRYEIGESSSAAAATRPAR